jgi:peptide chain release factor
MSSLTIEPALVQRMKRLGLREEDLEESFIQGTGPGGQKINKTSSTVQLRHAPTGMEVRCQEARQQSANRERAREMLCERMEKLRDETELALVQAKEKLRRQSRPRPYGLQQKILKQKSVRGEVKRRRSKPKAEE